jgi:hypothetical protein
VPLFFQLDGFGLLVDLRKKMNDRMRVSKTFIYDAADRLHLPEAKDKKVNLFKFEKWPM